MANDNNSFVQQASQPTVIDKLVSNVQEAGSGGIQAAAESLKETLRDNPNVIGSLGSGLKEFTMDRSLDQILESLPIGSVKRAIANNLYGINFRQTGNPVPRNKDSHGFIFFTRPQLNLSTLNITNYRGFYSLLSQNKASYQRYVRTILDPRMGGPGKTSKGIVCPFTDRSNVFISSLTNNCSSSSGWPDLSAPIYTSASGLYGQEQSFVDGVTNHFEAYDLDVTFKNTKGSPLLYMFYMWIKYQTLVVEGILNPYFDMIAENEIDYNTRIYRLVTDQQKRYVTQLCCTGASFPVNVPTGSIFDFNIEKPYNLQNSEINIRFRSMGFLAFEDIIKLYFNKAVGIFSKSMRSQLESDLIASSTAESTLRENPAKVYYSSDSLYAKIPFLLTASSEASGGESGYSFNHKAIPYINLYTSELEWWMPASEFDKSSRNLAEDVVTEGSSVDDEYRD